MIRNSRATGTVPVRAAQLRVLIRDDMITQFAMRLICGMSVVWCIMPKSQVSSGFFRIQMLVSLGLAVLGAVTVEQMPLAALNNSAGLSPVMIRNLAIVIAALSFLGSVMWTLERRTGGVRIARLIAAGSLLLVILSSLSPATLLTLNGGLYGLSELAIAMVSGATVTGMLLGHWYLTAPAMSTSPLLAINAWLAMAASFRLLLGLIAIILFRADVWTLGSTHLIWLSLEWLGGIAGPLAVAVMVHFIMKHRNTQSATGVLFVGVILAFLGEMTGALLRRELQLPL